ncbi:MAG TPA: hypothetical protein VF008_09830 [Niastella sp.]
MKYLKIQNDGELDIRLVALMGGTTKANDKYKIGQFGTGLKYTLAFLFRNNLSFKIFCGENEVDISTEVENIRGQNFEIICINGQRTSITTQMGEDWQPWMIVRELWCNALDEGNAAREITTELSGRVGATTFFIQVDKQIQSVIDNWAKYFIHEQEAIFADASHAIYPAGDRFCIYKQGVLISEHPELKSVFSYDMKCADINELREFRGSPSQVVVNCLCAANEKTARYFLENVTEQHFEGQSTMDYNWFVSFGEPWRRAIGSAKLIYQKALDDIKARGNAPDEAGLIVVPEIVYKALTKQFDGIGALHVADSIGEFYEDYNEQIEGKIKQAITILEACDYMIHPKLEFVYGWFGDKRVMARVSLSEKKVFICQALLQKPLFYIISTLIEENEHFNTGMQDKTREFQQHFIDLYTRQLLATNQVEI